MKRSTACFVLVIFGSFGPSDHGSDGDSPFLLTERYDLQAFLGIPGPVSRSEMNSFWVAQITQGWFTLTVVSHHNRNYVAGYRISNSTQVCLVETQGGFLLLYEFALGRSVGTGAWHGHNYCCLINYWVEENLFTPQLCQPTRLLTPLPNTIG